MSYTSLSCAINCVFTWPPTELILPITCVHGKIKRKCKWTSKPRVVIYPQVRTCDVSKPHIVHVVSILDVPIKLGSTSFQSKDVSGAQKSEFLFCKNERRQQNTSYVSAYEFKGKGTRGKIHPRTYVVQNTFQSRFRFDCSPNAQIIAASGQ